ncbi:MAG: hypothetical protein GY856_08360 [bacterium]|nr:hypothetical protein [bacterium]
MKSDQHGEAEREFRAALDLLGSWYPAERGDVMRRMTALRLAQERLAEAITLVDQAVMLTREHGTSQQFGLAVLERGVVAAMSGCYDDAADHFAESLRHLDHRESEETYYAAIHNLAAAIAKCPDPRRMSGIFAMLKIARAALPAGATDARVRLKWIEGLAYLRLGSNMRATAILKRVSRNLDGTAQEHASLALDLAQAHYMEGDHGRARDALVRALRLYQNIEGVNPVAVQAVARCLDRLWGDLPDFDPWSVRDAIVTGRLPAEVRQFAESFTPEVPMNIYWSGFRSPW